VQTSSASFTYNTVEDVIFHLAVELKRRFRFVSVNAAFEKHRTNAGRHRPVRRLMKCPRTVISQWSSKSTNRWRGETIVRWEETSDYPRAVDRRSALRLS
jgi:hypothetical protein